LSACRRGPDAYVVQSRSAPAGQPALSGAEGRIATATLARCDGGWCETLAIGASADAAQALATLPPSVERCTEIAWSPNGARVGFLINGTQLRLYDAATHAPAGQIDLVPRDADPSTRIARGLTFSDNGAAITFDDCPRDRSGCRPGMAALR
jgi:hypothetical protein